MPTRQPAKRVTSKAAAPVVKRAAIKGTTKPQPVRQPANKSTVQETKTGNTTRVTDPRKEVTRIGNLTNDPEIRFAANGTLVCSVDMAYNPYNFETKESGDPVFYRLVCFKELGEHVGECLQKGMRVIAVGNPQVNEWTSEDGEAHSRKEIICNALGPDLRWQKALVDRIFRRSPNASGQTSTTEYEEEPF